MYSNWRSSCETWNRVIFCCFQKFLALCHLNPTWCACEWSKRVQWVQWVQLAQERVWRQIVQGWDTGVRGTVQSCFLFLSLQSAGCLIRTIPEPKLTVQWRWTIPTTLGVGSLTCSVMIWSKSHVVPPVHHVLPRHKGTCWVFPSRIFWEIVQDHRGFPLSWVLRTDGVFPERRGCYCWWEGEIWSELPKRNTGLFSKKDHGNP